MWFFSLSFICKKALKKSINHSTINSNKFMLLCQFLDEKCRSEFFNELQTAFINSRSYRNFFRMISMCLCLGKQDWWGGDICDEKSRGWRLSPTVEFKVILQNISTTIWISFACFRVEQELVLELTFTKTMIEESGWADKNDTPREAMRAEQKQASIEWTNSLPIILSGFIIW